jgi:hypothetical protein
MWMKIRALGELQILTRASYALLLVVPILAGVWPAVRVAFNRYNDAISDSREALDSASDHLKYIAATLSEHPDASSSVDRILLSLDARLQSIVTDYALPPIENLSLPSVWAIAFFAALSVTFGHVIYQAFAPELVRRFTLRDYEREEVRSFVESPSQETLSRAKALIDPDGESDVDESDPLHEFSESQEQQRRREIALIEDAARSTYRDIASRDYGAAIAAGVSYGVALTLIAYITVTQAAKVWLAAWPS